MTDHRPPRSRRHPVALAVLAAVLVAGAAGGLVALVAGGDDVATSVDAVSSRGTSSSSPTLSTPSSASSPSSSASSSASSVASSMSSSTSAAVPSGSLTPDDRAAGLTGSRYPQDAGGGLHVVPGSAAAPGGGRTVRIRVEVENGLPVDGTAFAGFVMATLNDPRSWGHGGRMTFARSDDRYDIRVVLASPTTSRQMCRPLETLGTLSCHSGDAAVLTVYRWVGGTPDYGTDLTGYRHYLVNHEVGHALGHGHAFCAGKGAPAPVMMQQTKGLKGCAPNPWPFP